MAFPTTPNDGDLYVEGNKSFVAINGRWRKTPSARRESGGFNGAEVTNPATQAGATKGSVDIRPVDDDEQAKNLLVVKAVLNLDHNGDIELGIYKHSGGGMVDMHAALSHVNSFSNWDSSGSHAGVQSADHWAAAIHSSNNYVGLTTGQQDPNRGPYANTVIELELQFVRANPNVTTLYWEMVHASHVPNWFNTNGLTSLQNLEIGNIAGLQIKSAGQHINVLSYTWEAI